MTENGRAWSKMHPFWGRPWTHRLRVCARCDDRCGVHNDAVLMGLFSGERRSRSRTQDDSACTSIPNEQLPNNADEHKNYDDVPNQAQHVNDPGLGQGPDDVSYDWYGVPSGPPISSESRGTFAQDELIRLYPQHSAPKRSWVTTASRSSP